MKFLNFIIMLAFFSPIIGYSDNSYFKYGPGGGKSQGSKYFGLGIQKFGAPAYDWFVFQAEAGLVGESHTEDGRTSSGYGAISMGVDVSNGGLFIQTLWGVGYYTSPDSMLGGPVQFTNDSCLGLRDRHGASISLGWKHISSAGIYPINAGRDFPVFKMSVPF